MFNLKIQPTYIPGEQGAAWRKIRRCRHLMHSPCIVDSTGVGIRRGEDIALQCVCQLKDYGQRETQEEMHGHKSDKHVQDGVEKQGEYKSISTIEELREDKQTDVQYSALAQSVGPNMA